MQCSNPICCEIFPLDSDLTRCSMLDNLWLFDDVFRSAVATASVERIR